MVSTLRQFLFLTGQMPAHTKSTIGKLKNRKLEASENLKGEATHVSINIGKSFLIADLKTYFFKTKHC